MNVKILSLSVIFGALALGGCATAKQTVLPSGQQGLSVNCSGGAMSWNACYEKAGKTCPHGYDVISKDGDSGNGSAFGGGGIFGGGMHATRSMLIACKA